MVSPGLSTLLGEKPYMYHHFFTHSRWQRLVHQWEPVAHASKRAEEVKDKEQILRTREAREAVARLECRPPS
jgi:hypothetical protein